MFDKKEDLIHISHLHFVLKMGVRLERVHRVYTYTQSPWIRGYMTHLTGLRNKATNPFFNSLFKTCQNSIYGKLLLNNERYATNARLCNSYGPDYYIRHEMLVHHRRLDNDLYLAIVKKGIQYKIPTYARLLS